MSVYEETIRTIQVTTAQYKRKLQETNSIEERRQLEDKIAILNDYTNQLLVNGNING